MNRLIFTDIFKGHVTAFFTGKDPGADLKTVSRILNVEQQDIFMPIQRHTDKVLLVESSLEPRIADAVLTKSKGVLIGIQVADCVPVLLHAKGKDVVGAVHAGWRGSAEGIVKKTIKTLMDRFYVDGKDIMIAIGPCIKWCCYEVGRDVLDSVRNATGEGGYYKNKGGKYYLDLAAANRLQALSTGIPESNIWMSDDCTHCNPDRYYSYRYSKGPTGRQAGFIGIV